jgi:enoyl-[acyl-carrier-protein] reductase (NADH)
MTDISILTFIIGVAGVLIAAMAIIIYTYIQDWHKKVEKNFSILTGDMQDKMVKTDVRIESLVSGLVKTQAEINKVLHSIEIAIARDSTKSDMFIQRFMENNVETVKRLDMQDSKIESHAKILGQHEIEFSRLKTPPNKGS